MPRYPNGQIPESELVIFNRGVTVHTLSNGERITENWYQGLTPGTYQKHRALVALTGGRLQVSRGFSCYRPLYGQSIARRLYGNGAASVGTSSHGGYWEGRDTMAIDYGNWSAVYGGNREAFYADCRKVGLSPGLISPGRGYPDEPWHVIDFEPWRAVTAGGGGTPFPLEEDMGTIENNDANKQVIKDAILEFFENTSTPRTGRRWKFLDNQFSVDKQEVKDSIFEFYLDTRTPPAGRETWPFFDFLIKAINTGSVEIDYDLLATKVAEKISGSADVQEIAQATRDLFRSDPLN